MIRRQFFHVTILQDYRVVFVGIIVFVQEAASQSRRNGMYDRCGAVQTQVCHVSHKREERGVFLPRLAVGFPSSKKHHQEHFPALLREALAVSLMGLI